MADTEPAPLNPPAQEAASAGGESNGSRSGTPTLPPVETASMPLETPGERNNTLPPLEDTPVVGEKGPNNEKSVAEFL